MSVFDRGEAVSVTSLTRSRESLGGIFVRNEHVTARKYGIQGIILGTNPVADRVYFVNHVVNGHPVISVYGAEELERIDDRDNTVKLALILSLRQASRKNPT